MLLQRGNTMCLGVPMRVIEIDCFAARCEARGIERKASLFLLQHEDIQVGDLVMIHVGNAIQKMTEEEFIAFGESKPLRKDFFLRMGRKGYSDEEMQQAENRLRMTVERMEAQLQPGGPWLLGEYSLADICIIPVIVRLNDIGLSKLWADCDQVKEWFSRFLERDALRKTFYFGSLLSEQYEDVKTYR